MADSHKPGSRKTTALVGIRVNSFFALSVMKTRLALLLGGAMALSAAPALAQTATNATNANQSNLPGGAVTLFQVNTAQPSVMDFRGTGTATYSNSTGTSNSINLGSNTTLGISANLATSKEYEGTATANFSLTGPPGADADGVAQSGTTFLQTIGSATGAANMQAAAKSTSEQAHNSASQKADTIVESKLGSTAQTYANDFNAAKATLAGDLGITLDANGSATASGGGTSEEFTAAQNESRLGKALSSAGVKGNIGGDGSLQQYSETEWNTAVTNEYEKAYNDSYSEAYTQAASNQSEMNTTDNSSGKVTGTFNTTNTGTGNISLSASEIATLATASASGTNGSSWDSSATKAVVYDAGQSSSDVNSAGSFTNNTTDKVTRIENANGTTSDEWSESYKNDYTEAMAGLTTAGSNSSNSVVNVEGLGNIANVGAQDDSNFNVALQARNPGVVGEENGTASGGAGMSLVTNSSAAVSSSQFASSFIQAFAGDIPQNLVDANASLINAAAAAQ